METGKRVERAAGGASAHPASSTLRALHIAQEDRTLLFTVSDSIHIHAPIKRCFLLSTSLELVEQMLEVRPVAGDLKKTSGPVVGGDRVEWHGWLFGMPQVHESLITRYERPGFFQDTMTRGRFKRFQHDHLFTEIDGHTLVVDKLQFSLPLGWPGKIVARRVLVPYLSGLLRRRMMLLGMWPRVRSGGGTFRSRAGRWDAVLHAYV